LEQYNKERTINREAFLSLRFPFFHHRFRRDKFPRNHQLYFSFPICWFGIRVFGFGWVGIAAVREELDWWRGASADAILGGKICIEEMGISKEEMAICRGEERLKCD
jgi:hypothetical protein